MDMQTPDLPISRDNGTPQESLTDSAYDITSLTRKILCDAPNLSIVSDTLSTPFNEESNSPITTLSTSFAYLLNPDATAISEFYNTFATVVSEDIHNTLLVFAKDEDKNCLPVYFTASYIHPDPRVHCMPTLKLHWNKVHPLRLRVIT